MAIHVGAAIPIDRFQRRVPGLTGFALFAAFVVRLNPRSPGDQQILSWLEQFAPYYRADAIRTALFTHILRRTGGGDPPPGSVPQAPASVPPASSTAAQKLEIDSVASLLQSSDLFVLPYHTRPRVMSILRYIGRPHRLPLALTLIFAAQFVPRMVRAHTRRPNASYR